jgi:hypothetical protein
MWRGGIQVTQLQVYQWQTPTILYCSKQHHFVSMESTDAHSLTSPASTLVALVTIIFLLHRAWPHLFQLKADKVAESIPITSSNDSDLAVSKESEIPEGWWNGREVFELERRALFSQVIEIRVRCSLTELLTYSSRHGSILPTAPSSRSPGRINLSTLPAFRSFSFGGRTIRSALSIMSVDIVPTLLPEKRLAPRPSLVVVTMAGAMIPLVGW